MQIIEKMSIPSSISKISDYMFFNCSSLSEIKFLSPQIEIGDFEFFNCSSLSEIYSTSTIVTKVGDFAFNGCKLLKISTIQTETIELEPKKISCKQFENENIKNYIQNRKEIYQNLLNFLESQDIENETDNLIKLIHFFNEKNMPEDEYDLIEFLNLITKLSENHHRSTHFISRIKEILNIYKEEIRTKLPNLKIFNIFKNNKIILQYLFEKNIIRINNTIFQYIYDPKIEFNDNYFMPQILEYKNKKFLTGENLKIINTIKEKQRIGENDSQICQIIRNDSIDDFITYVENEKKQRSNKIPTSAFETHPLLISSHYNYYLNYAAFFGSFKIFKLLFEEKYDPKEEEIKYQWLYKDSINGNNIKILQLIEQKNIKPRNIKHNYSLSQNDIRNLSHLDFAIYCHHNQIAQYLKNKKEMSTDCLTPLKCFNYMFIDDFYDKFCNDDCLLLYYMSMYDYPKFSQILINAKNIDINQYSDQNKIINPSNNYYKVTDEKKIICELVIKENDIIKYLIEQKNKKIEFDGKSLIEAVSNENIELIKIMLCQSNLDINDVESLEYNIGNEECSAASALFLAIVKNNMKIINLLLQYPLINVNLYFYPTSSRSTERTALHVAILLNNIEIIKLLLNRQDVDVNFIANYDETTFPFQNWSITRHFDQYFSPLHAAIELGNIEIVKLLLNHPKISVNQMEIFETYYSDNESRVRVKQTALCRVIQKNDFEMFKLLLNQPNIDVNTPAVLIPNARTAYMYEKNVNYDDKKGVSKKAPLQFACESKSLDFIKLLLSRNDIEKINLNDNKNDNEEVNFTTFINKNWNS